MCRIIEIKKTDISEMSVFNNLEGILPILYIFAGCFFLSFGETFSGIGFRLQTTSNLGIEYLINYLPIRWRYQKTRNHSFQGQQ